MASAIPLDSNYTLDETVLHSVAAAVAAAAQVGEPIMVPGYNGGEYLDGVALPSQQDQTKRSFSGSYPTPSTSFPLCTIGKIYFKFNGASYVCSGTVVGQHIVFTAGHCVYNTNWATDFLFVPGYDQGSKPFGTFSAYQLFAPTGFINGWTPSVGSARGLDMAIAVLNRNNGNSVRDVVGSYALYFNMPVSSLVTSFGYPASSPFNGERDYKCQNTGSVYYDNTYSPVTLGFDCDATGGSSGGPRFMYNPSNGATYMTGVNGYTSGSAQYGVQFQDAAFSLYNDANSVSL